MSDLIERAEKCAAEVSDRRGYPYHWDTNAPEIIRELIKKVRFWEDLADHQAKGVDKIGEDRLRIYLRYEGAVAACQKVLDDSKAFGDLMLTPEAKERCRQVVSDFSQKK